MTSLLPRYALAFVLVSLAGLAGCAEKLPVLHVYTWSDYMAPGLVERFEDEQGCRVILDYFDSNEAMYAKLKAGATGYDVVIPSSYMVHIMHEQDMLLPLDHGLIPNLRHVDRAYLRFTMDPDMHHSVPYMIGTTGIGYLNERVPDADASWTLFANPAYAGRTTLLNDMRETLGAALKSLGYSLNSTNDAELAEARDVVIGWKQHIAKFESDQYKNGLASAEFLICQGYSGDVMQAMEENEDIQFVVPREGTSLASDDMAILKQARAPDLAHAFINFMHEPEIAAENTDFVWYLAPNTAAYPLVDEDVRTDPAVFLSDEVLANCEAIRDLGDYNATYVAAWDAVKAAK